MAKKNDIPPKQKKFIQEWLKDFNGTQAAIRAGYSPKTAKVTASQLLTKPNLLEYREKLMKELEKSNIADLNEILEYFTRVMRREEKENVVVTIKEKQSGWATNKQTGKREKVTVEKETPQVVEIPTKVSDANKAAEMLGKYYSAWTEKVNLDTDQKITFVEDLPTDEDMGE